MTDPAKPLRADAERNRQAIICAAGTVFAEEGTGVTLERIDRSGTGQPQASCLGEVDRVGELRNTERDRDRHILAY